LVDLDGTLKDHYAAVLDQNGVAWVERMRADGIGMCLVSNGPRDYVERFGGMLQLPFVGRARKPLIFRCRRAMQRAGFEAAGTALVGDQLFTDVLTGRRLGIFTIGVRPINTSEPWHTRLKRPLERLILARARPAALEVAAADRSDIEAAH
jgi:HAD superfamily phosphatase (TIGR01668 family)